MGKNNACQKGATHFLKRGYCVDDEEIPCPNARKRPGEKGPGGRGQKGPPRPLKDVTRRLGTSPGPLRHEAAPPRFRRRSAVGLPPGGDIYGTKEYVTRPGMPPPTKRIPNINLGGVAAMKARREARRASDQGMADFMNATERPITPTTPIGAPPRRRSSTSSLREERNIRDARTLEEVNRALEMRTPTPEFDTNQFFARTPSPLRTPSPMNRSPSPALSRSFYFLC
jgi:hypothetical protein